MLQLDQSAIQARNRLLVMFVLLCILDIVLVMMARDRWAIGRILLTIIVMYFVLQGRKWAKWLLVGICSLLIVMLVAMVAVLSAKLSPALIIGSFMLCILNAAVITDMLRNQDLKRYFAYQRQLSGSS